MIPAPVAQALLAFVEARRAQVAWYARDRKMPDPRREDRIEDACAACETAFLQALDEWVAAK